MCSLQEAYNVESFAPPKKRKNAACLPGPSASASAEPYDHYTSESGRGELARAYNRYNREDFADVTPQSKVKMGDREKVTYKGATGDYDYYRSTWGVDLPKMREGFTNGNANANAKEQRGKPLIRASPSPHPRCSLSPQRYEIPVDAEARREYDRTFEAALNDGEDSGATIPPRPLPRKVDMSGVMGYEDEDLEQYLKTNEMTAAPMPRASQRTFGPAPATPDAHDPDATPFSEAMTSLKTLTPNGSGVPSRASIAPPPSSSTKPRTGVPKDSWQGFWEILLFVLAGILIIFLCEQLFKLAIMVGMRRTIDMLEPYLAQMTK